MSNMIESEVRLARSADDAEAARLELEDARRRLFARVCARRDDLEARFHDLEARIRGARANIASPKGLLVAFSLGLIYGATRPGERPRSHHHAAAPPPRSSSSSSARADRRSAEADTYAPAAAHPQRTELADGALSLAGRVLRRAALKQFGFPL